MQFKLSTQQTQNYYMMTEAEFARAMDEFFYIYDEKQTKVFYETSLRQSMAVDGYSFCVPIDKLCFIASYYYLIQVIQEFKLDLDEYVKKAREKRKELAIGTLDKSHQLVEWKDEFIKISDIDKLSNTL